MRNELAVRMEIALMVAEVCEDTDCNPAQVLRDVMYLEDWARGNNERKAAIVFLSKMWFKLYGEDSE